MTESMNDLMSMSDDGSFEPGGAVPFPSELLGQFGMNANGDGTEPETRESQPNDKKKKENYKRIRNLESKVDKLSEAISEFINEFKK